MGKMIKSLKITFVCVIASSLLSYFLYRRDSFFHSTLKKIGESDYLVISERRPSADKQDEIEKTLTKPLPHYTNNVNAESKGATLIISPAITLIDIIYDDAVSNNNAVAIVNAVTVIAVNVTITTIIFTISNVNVTSLSTCHCYHYLLSLLSLSLLSLLLLSLLLLVLATISTLTIATVRLSLSLLHCQYCHCHCYHRYW
jgi:hypothetical protein